jgi:hypothetical protein
MRLIESERCLGNPLPARDVAGHIDEIHRGPVLESAGPAVRIEGEPHNVDGQKRDAQSLQQRLRIGHILRGLLGFILRSGFNYTA